VKFGKIFKIFKKGAKVASKRQGQGGASSEFDWPSGTRIGIFGHANSGKSVYYTVLNEECKVSRDLQISVTDGATAGEFLANFRAIWGIGATSDVGTVVDLQEEKKFPDSTEGDRVLQFTAIIDRDKKIQVVGYDYDGNAVDISKGHELNRKVIDFLSGCDGLLLFFDPKVLASDVRCQAHVAAFVNMLEQLAPLNSRLPIPVALVVTKSDILPGFSGEDQTVLVDVQDENILAEDFESFLEFVLSSNKIASNSTWAGTVRNIMVKLQEFLKVVVGRTLDFQVFFSSNTGQPPEKIGTDVGRSVYAPPKRMHPAGVREPYYWLLKSIIRSRRLSLLRKVTKLVGTISVLWIILFSIPYLFHFSFLLPQATKVEDNILESHNGNLLNTSKDECNRIVKSYSDYQYSKTVKWFFPKYLVPARQIRDRYRNFNLGTAATQLNKLIARVSAVVQDTTLWPKVNPANDSLLMAEIHEKLETDLDGYHQGDETSVLFTRSGRVLVYWDLFKKALVNRSDASAWDIVVEQINHDNNLYGSDISSQEKALGVALNEASLAGQQKTATRESVRQAGGEFEQLVTQINANTDPAYRIDKAVTKLRELKGVMQGNPARQGDVERINTYLSQASYFTQSQKYSFTLTNCPDGHHVHILVKKRGRSGDWLIGKQLHKGRSDAITWRSGDHILIALDANDHGGQDESWGANPGALKEIKSKAAIFEMNGDVTFPGGETISFSFKQDLNEKLPKF